MTEQQQRSVGSQTARVIHAVSKPTYDGHTAEDRQIIARIRARLHSEMYRREREHYPEYIDHGGEGG